MAWPSNLKWQLIPDKDYNRNNRWNNKTLDGKINLLIDFDYINGLLDSEDTCQAIETKTAISKMCWGHIMRGQRTLF